MGNTITLNDIAFAGILALIITWMLLSISKIFKVSASAATGFNYKSTELNRILQKWYTLFPRDIIQFKGKTYKRGMRIRIVTVQQKIFEGELIGVNSENILCVLTSRYILTHEMSGIKEIVVIELSGD